MKLSTTLANAEATAAATLFNNGYIRIYSGSQPATPETTATGTLLATLRFGATAFGAPSAGVLTANAITSDSDCAATGTAGYYRVLESDGTTVLVDGTIGTSAADMIVATTSIVQHATYAVTSYTHTIPKS